MSKELIWAKIETLPEESRKQLLAFLDFLAERARQLPQPEKPPGFKFGWAGGLADAYPGMTSFELQHKASEWR